MPYATAGHKNALVDSTTVRYVDSLNDKKIRIVKGKGFGQERKIFRNTAFVIAIYGEWGIIPDNTSEYEII